LIHIAGAFGIVVRDPGYPSQPLFNLDVGVACPPKFSVDFAIPTEGPDDYDKTLLVDITDSYRTIKVTIFRPAPNMTAEAYGRSITQCHQSLDASNFRVFFTAKFSKKCSVCIPVCKTDV